MVGTNIIMLIVLALGVFRMVPVRTEVDVVFLVSMILWALVEAGNDEKEFPGLLTTVRRIGLFIASGYVIWIATYHIG